MVNQLLLSLIAVLGIHHGRVISQTNAAGASLTNVIHFINDGETHLCFMCVSHSHDCNALLLSTLETLDPRLELDSRPPPRLGEAFRKDDRLVLLLPRSA